LNAIHKARLKRYSRSVLLADDIAGYDCSHGLKEGARKELIMFVSFIPAILALTFFAIVLLSAAIQIGTRRAERGGDREK
jgi:hypothetical protein